MTKASKQSTKAELTTDTITTADAPVIRSAAQKLPFTVPCIGPAPIVLATAAALIRKGYVFSEMPIEMIPAAGVLSFTLQLGQPDAISTNAAIVLLQENTEREEREYQKDVEAAALRLVEDRERAKRQTEKAAEIAARQAEIRKLQDEIAAE